MSNYTFSSLTASNGVVLKVMVTPASNIVLKYINGNVNAQNSYGISGGFFDFTSPRTCLSIAMNNDTPVSSTANANAVYARGTLLYDAFLNTLQVQVVSTKSQLAFTRPDMYWAQGGISMMLQDDVHWQNQAYTTEQMPNPTGGAYRAGIVYDSSKNVYLIVTDANTTASNFRAAIKNQITGYVDGVFLDGDGSAQMKCSQFAGHGSDPDRVIAQMIALKFN